MFSLRKAVIATLLSVASVGVVAETLPAADGPGGIAGVKSWANGRLSAAETDFAASGNARMASPNTWSNQIVYQIQVDRFNNGDLSNDSLNVSQYQQDHRFTDQRGIQDYRHGGDLQGIIDRMDYLQDLGVTALWVTPILKGDGSYHGYCTSDFSQVDPGFGTNQKLRELTAAAHARGIRVVLDIVVNHMCNNDSGYSSAYNETNYTNCTADLQSLNSNGSGSIRGQRQLNMGASFFPPFRSQSFFSRCGNKAGDFSGEGNGALWGDFSDKMFDLNTLNWDMQDIFTDLHKWWIAYADVDGFRLDAAKHISPDFVAKLSTDARAYAKSLGKNNFYVVGEVASTNVQGSLRTGYMRSDINNPLNSSDVNVPASLKNRLVTLKNTYLAHGIWNRPGQNALYDFYHSGTMVDAFRNVGGRTPLSIKQYFYTGSEADNSTISPDYSDLTAAGDTGLNWNIIEIHDWPRFALWSKNKDHLKGAIGYLMSARGAPVLYYGVEQGFHAGCDFSKINLSNTDTRNEVTGVCNASDYFNHARYRQDMFIHGPWRLGSVESSINGLAQIGFDSQPIPSSWQTDPYLKRDHDMYKTVRKLANIRKSCAALNYGQPYFRQAWGNADGLLAFSRIFEGKEILVVQNFGSTSRQLTTLSVDSGINSSKVGSTYRNLLNGFQRGRVNSGGGTLSFFTLNGASETSLWINAYGTMIFVHESNVSNYDSNLETHLCGTPVSNAAPTANAGADQTLTVGANVTQVGSGTDSDGTIASYQWKEGSTVLGNAATLNLSGLAAGVHTLTLTVTDNGGATASDTAVVTVTATGTTSFKVYFKKSATGWSTPKIHFWALVGSTPTSSPWPGNNLTAVLGVSNLYEHTFNAGTTSTNLLFNDGVGGSGRQTADQIGVSSGNANLCWEQTSGASGSWKTAAACGISTNAAPSANAGADQTITEGSAVSLSGSGTDSDGSIASYQWKEGANVLGSSATLTVNNPTVGVHTYTLTVTDNGGGTGTDTVVGNVNNVLPIAGAAASASAINESQGVTLTGSGADIVGSVSYQWKEGSSVLGTSATLVLSNIDAGLHSYLLQITDDEGSVATASAEVSVANLPPSAAAGADQSINEGSIAVLSGSGSDAAGSVGYQWKEGSSVLGTSAALNVSNLSVGSHTLTLIVTDNEGSSASDDLVVTVADLPNQVPTANAGADQSKARTSAAGANVSVTGSGSDSDGTLSAYEWKEGATVLGTSANLTQSFALGVHTLTLTVTDNEGASASDDVIVTVTNAVPSANAGADVAYISGGSTTLTASGNDVDGSITSYEWKEGSSVLCTTATCAYNSASVGPHTVTLTVTDNDGASATDNVVVTVNSAAMKVYFKKSATGWSTPKIHFWALVGSTPTSTSWPGNNLTAVLGVSNLYEYTFNAGTTSTNLLFNDGVGGSGRQTANQTGISSSSATLCWEQTSGASGSWKTLAACTSGNSNVAPTANAGADQTLTVGANVTQVGSGTDSDGTIASYQWKEGNTVLGSAATLSLSGLAVGVHTLTLTVTDNGGATGTDTVVVTVTSSATGAAVTFTCNNIPTVNSGEAVFIAGDHSLLGSWAVPASTAATQKLTTINGNSRSGTISGLPASTARQFKCVIAPAAGGTVRLWGSGANQSVTAGANGSTVTKAMNFNN